MEIRFAETRDIPGMINLLLEVGEVHHRIRPDLFRAGAQKYDEQTLARMLTDDTRPIFVAVEDGRVLGYCFCILLVRKNDPDYRTLQALDAVIRERGFERGRSLPGQARRAGAVRSHPGLRPPNRLPQGDAERVVRQRQRHALL